MKQYIIIFLALITCTPLILSQNAERPDGDTVHLEIEVWENYFQERAKTNGSSVWEKSSGYKPFSRFRRMYDQLKRRDGLHDQQRWHQYTAIKQKSIHSRLNNPTAEWTNIGPQTLDGQGGRMIAHAFDPFHSDTIWAGSASGGLWRTLDGGDWWEPMTDQIPSTGVGAISIHPDSSHIIVIGTGEGFLSGQQYNPTIRGGIGIFKSTDFGLTWSRTSFDFPRPIEVSVMSMVWDKSDVNNIWAGATNGLWKSTDQGETWTLKLGDGTNHGGFIIDEVIIHPLHSDTMWAAIESNGIAKSTDGGETWSLLGNGLPFSDLNFISLDICIQDPRVLYANISSGPSTGFGLRGVYRSADGGQSWNKLVSAPAAQCSPQFLSACQGWYNNIIAVSPVDPNEVIMGGVTTWMSKDAGVTWVQKDRLICTNCIDAPPCTFFVDQHDIGYDMNNPDRIFIFNDGGVARTEDGGECWEEINAGLITSQFYAISSAPSNPNIVVGGFQDHGLQGVNLANSLKWEKWGFFDGSDAAVHPSNENIIYGSWFDGTYWKSTNGIFGLANSINVGINQFENTSQHYAPLRVHPDNGNILLGSTQQNIYVSNNGGTSWSPRQAAANVTEVAFSQVDPSVCYAAGWTGSSWSFWRSNDTGMSWQSTASAPGWRVTDLKTSGQHSGTIFASRNSINSGTAHVYRSTDFGESWQPIQGDLPDIFVHGLAVNHFNDDVIYVATDLGIFITIDGGSTWTEYNDNLPIAYVLDIEFVPSDTTIIIGTHGRGAWRSPAFTPLNSSTINHISSISDLQIFPNPMIDEFTLTIDIQRAGNYTIDLYNLNGQLLKRLGNIRLNKGRHEESLVLQTSINGLYFIRVSNGKIARWERIVVNN